MDMILFEVFLKSIDLIPQQQILQRHYVYYMIMSLYYLILWNQVNIQFEKHFKKDHPYAPLDEVLRYKDSNRTRGER